MDDNTEIDDHYELNFPPIFNPESSNVQYNVWKIKLKYLAKLTAIPKKKQGLAVALSMPEGSEIRKKLFTDLNKETVFSDTGLEVIIEYLDKIYLKNVLGVEHKICNEFICYNKKINHPMEDYIVQFERLCKRAEKYDLNIDNASKGFLLLNGAQLSHSEELAVLTSVNFNERNSIYINK